MKLSSPIKRKKLEIKPVKLSYYSHTSDNKSSFPVKPIPRRLRSAVKIVACFIFAGALIPFIYYLINANNFLEVTEVVVYGEDNFVPVKEVLTYSESKVLGKSILSLSTKEYEKYIKDTFLAVDKASMKIKWPNKIIVNITERIPVAILDNYGNKFFVDKEGYVMKQLSEDSYNYPEIVYEEKVNVGQFINQNIVPLSVELNKHAKDSNLVINKMQFNSQYISLNINDNIVVDLSLQKDNVLAMKQISAIIQKTSSEGQKLRKVDLRFEKVIVLYD